MTLPEIIAIIVLTAVLGAAIGYIIYSKRKGKACIGCPGSCNGKCSGCTACKEKHE